MQSAYSYLGCRIHLVIEDEEAEAFNRVVDAFIDAQDENWNHKSKTLFMDVESKDVEIYNKLGKLFTTIIEVTGAIIPEEEITSDYLVKL